MKGRANIALILIDDSGWKDLGRCGSSFYETRMVRRLIRARNADSAVGQGVERSHYRHFRFRTGDVE